MNRPRIRRVSRKKLTDVIARRTPLGLFLTKEGRKWVDNAWIFDNAISCNNANVDNSSSLRGEAIACENAYVSGGAKLLDHARAEDYAYICGGIIRGNARISDCARILLSSDKTMLPMLSDNCIVYGTVCGNVRVEGQTVILRNEEIYHNTPETLVIRESGRSIIRDPARDKLAQYPAG